MTAQVKVHSIKEEKRFAKRKGGKTQENAARCKTDVLYPDSTPLPTLNWDADLGGAQRSHTVREMKLLYLWMFLLRISEHGPSTRSKRILSSFTHLSGPRATTVAALGRFSSKAISPVEEG